ncbi:hypothetical protein [Agrobacterium vitis]|uniref:hypothetical protein n=1 Tax=Agrobacterium vitis TaxID=373 RepID=UPI003D2BC658
MIGTKASIFLGLSLYCAPAGAAYASDICASAMPTGYGYPANPVELWKISGGIKSDTLDIPGKIDIVRQRAHGWLLFAAATHPVDNKPNALPVFHTWYTVEEAFDPSPGKIDCTKRQNEIHLTLPTQLEMVVPNRARDVLRASGLEPSARFDPDPSSFGDASPAQAVADAHDGVVAFSHVAFNQEMYDWIRDNQYYSKAALDKIIDQTVARKKLIDPPEGGISLKFSWWPIAPDGLTPVPVWDNDPRYPGDAKNFPTTWTRVVVVDPIGGQQTPAKVTLGGFDHSNPRVVSINDFYHLKISDEEASLGNADFRVRAAAMQVLGRPLKGGDFIAMTALHIATREFEPWVFTTFWWSDAPSQNPLGADMPKEVHAAFRNYIMDVSYNINGPKTPDGKAPVSYNPWLELFQIGGTRSQCMACHARSAYGPKTIAFFNPADMSTKDPNGFEATPQNPGDPNFLPGTLDLQRVWTIQTRAH